MKYTEEEINAFMKSKRQLTIAIENENFIQIKRISDNQHKSMSDIVNIMIKYYLEREVGK